MGHMLIFDIGKTNKKVFIFDQDYRKVHQAYARFEEKMDEEGFPCDDLTAIRNWVQQTIRAIFKEGKYEIKAINFSTYGASFVHLDTDGQPVTPLYNYLKPLSETVSQYFYQQYGSPLSIARDTASPPLGMLNSGLQLYWIKYARPDVFKKIRWSLHLPQYLSYLLTGVVWSEYTSIGCHTSLWDFTKHDYHNWVYQEGINRILPPIVHTTTSMEVSIAGQKVKVGVGIHDSSSALLPYIWADRKPFLLISTGTWSIALNPFNAAFLTDEDLQQDCLNFLQIDGQPIKAVRLFLGEEYKKQVKILQRYFGQSEGAHRKVDYNEHIHQMLLQNKQYHFAFVYLKTPWRAPEKSNLEAFQNFTEGYHQLMLELVQLQVAAAKRAIGQINIQKLYVDGGFADNEVYIQLLIRHFPDVKIRTTQTPLGSALGAALVVADGEIDKTFLKNNYALKKHDSTF